MGTVIENPSKINGKGGNNHHGFAKFKDKWYAVYHDRRLVMASEKPKLTNGQTPTTTGNHRSVSIDELTWNGDKMNVVKFTDAGPAQVGKFDPYQTYKALTSSKQRNVRSRTDYTRGQAVVHVLTPLATKESWIRVSGVDFGKGAENLRIKAANVGDGNKVEIHKGSVSGTLAGTCELAKTSGWNNYSDNDCAMTGLSGVVDELFFVFKGSKDSTMGILEWEFQGTKREPEPQTPYGDKAASIPGKIEAEIFDKPGYGAGNDSYSDNDTDNQGDAEFRAEDGVDVVLGGSGMAIGYTNAGEWMEYTVDVAEDGDYPIVVNASSGAENSGFCFTVDEKPMGDTVKVTKTGDDWSVYKEFEAGTAKLTKGKHIIRLTITGNNVNIDWFSVGKAEKQDGPGTDGIAPRMRFDVNTVTSYRVFNVAGKQVGTVNLRGKTPATALAEAGFTQGIYMLKSFDGRKKFMVSSAR